MFSSQSAFAGGAGTSCTSSGDCSGDGNVCTTATCLGFIDEIGICPGTFCTPAIPGTCSNLANTNSCDDGNACTSFDSCVAGLCGGINNFDSCNDTDNNECTSGLCAGGSCEPVPNFNSCDDTDNNECTSGRCQGGSCVPNANFDSCTDTDNNECTSGLCAVELCVPTPNTNQCDDGNVCTSGDICAGGTCVGAPNIAFCDDDNDCTSGDVCTLSLCVGDLLPPGASCGNIGTECTNQNTCNITGQCLDNGQQADGSSCGSPGDTECSNADTCFDGQCVPNDETVGTACGDAGTECTNQDTCDGGGACADSGIQAVGTACGDPADTECKNSDTCNDIGNCQSNDEPDNTSCDDGELCTIDEFCKDGVCGMGTETPILACMDDDSEPGSDVGGTIIPIDTISLILAGTQTIMSWLIPVTISAIGITIVIARKFSKYEPV